MLDKALDHWKQKFVGLFALSAIMGTYYMDSGSESAGLMASGANVLLLGLLIAVPARAIRRRPAAAPAFVAVAVSALVLLMAPDFWARYDPEHGMDVGLTVLWVLIGGAVAYTVASAALFVWRRTQRSRPLAASLAAELAAEGRDDG